MLMDSIPTASMICKANQVDTTGRKATLAFYTMQYHCTYATWSSAWSSTLSLAARNINCSRRVDNSRQVNNKPLEANWKRHFLVQHVRLRSIQRQARVQRTFKIIPYLTWFEVYFHLICQSPGRQTSELYALPAAREHAHPDVGAVPAFSYDKFVESSLRITVSLNCYCCGGAAVIVVIDNDIIIAVVVASIVAVVAGTIVVVVAAAVSA